MTHPASTDMAATEPPGTRILAVLNRPATAMAVLVAAATLRTKLPSSELAVLHPRPDVDPDFMPTEEVWTDDRRDAFAAKGDALARQLQEVFETWQRQNSTLAGVSLRQVVGPTDSVIQTEAANADVVVLGSAGKEHDPAAKQAIKTVLFHSGASLLLVPPSPSLSFGRSIAVAWEPSEAADEAVATALPLLMAAERVTILVAAERHGDATLPTMLLQALQQHGNPVQLHHFDLDGHRIGVALIKEARSVAADLLVMGAFTHNRTMEALFGGATREILAGADLPVLMHR